MAIVISPALFVVGQNSALWLDKATADEIKVLGLQGMGLGLGFSQSSIDVPMMGVRIAPKVYTGATYDEMSINANYIPGDPSQAALQAAALAGTMLKNVRMYLKDGCNFSAPDQPAINDGGLVSGSSGLNVGSYGDPSIGAPSDIYTNTVTMAPGGPFTIFVAHTVVGNGADVSVVAQGASGATLTHADTDWEDLGFEAGDTVIVDWCETTPCYGRIDTLVTTVMTLEEDVGDAASLSTKTLPSNGAVHGASPTEVGALSTTC